MRKFFGTSTGWLVYQEVVAAIRTLPQEYQLPMFWRYVERKSYSDIAVKTKNPNDPDLDYYAYLLNEETQFIELMRGMYDLYGYAWW